MRDVKKSVTKLANIARISEISVKRNENKILRRKNAFLACAILLNHHYPFIQLADRAEGLTASAARESADE